jgi:hypothetical protein
VATNNNTATQPQNQSLNEDLTRATYRPTANHSEFTASSRYDFDIQLCFDPQENPAYQLIISRRADGSVVHQAFYYSTEDVDDAASAWKVQLGVASMDRSMWGSL